MATDKHLFWFNLGMDLGLVLSMCLFKNTTDSEVKQQYKELEARIVDVKVKILDGRLGEKDVDKLDNEAECIIGAYRKLVGR
jgi:hypothetical protein